MCLQSRPKSFILYSYITLPQSYSYSMLIFYLFIYLKKKHTEMRQYALNDQPWPRTNNMLAILFQCHTQRIIVLWIASKCQYIQKRGNSISESHLSSSACRNVVVRQQQGHTIFPVSTARFNRFGTKLEKKKTPVWREQMLCWEWAKNLDASLNFANSHASFHLTVRNMWYCAWQSLRKYGQFWTVTSITHKYKCAHKIRATVHAQCYFTSHGVAEHWKLFENPVHLH